MGGIKTKREQWLESELKFERSKRGLNGKKKRRAATVVYNSEKNTDTIGVALKYREQLVANATRAEKILLNKIKKSVYADDFSFQHIIYIKSQTGRIKKFYIADFVILSKNIIIELDGDYHNDLKQMKNDAKRTFDLEKEGYVIIRVKNEMIENHTDCEYVFNRIEEESKYITSDKVSERNKFIDEKIKQTVGERMTLKEAERILFY